MTKKQKKFLENTSIRLYDELPKGWIIKAEVGSPLYGYSWCFNGKSIFSKEYEHALVRVNEN